MKRQTQSQILAAITIVFWASAFVFTRIALETLPPMALAALRYVLAAILILPVAAHGRIGLPPWRDIPLFLATGALGFTIYVLAFNLGSQTVPAAAGSVLVAAAPIFTAILARLALSERIAPLGWVFIVLGFAGICVLCLWDQSLSLGSGAGWMLLAALSMSGYQLLQRRLGRRYRATQITCFSMWAGALLLTPLLPYALKSAAAAPPSAWGMVLALAIFPSAVGYLLWGMAMEKTDLTSRVSNFMFLTPLFSGLMGFALRGEKPGGSVFAGGALILLGVVGFDLVQKRKREKSDGSSL